jgi:murein DD-endopeptidase MepM/ murein hydrolase activator NlpD
MKSYEFLTEAEDTKSYEIKPGDTLTKIASKNSTTIDAIMDLNRGNRAIRDRDTIYAGGTIKIPTTSTGFDSDARIKRQGATSGDKPDDVAKIGNQKFPLTKGPGAPDANDDMGGKNFGIDDTDWESPTAEPDTQHPVGTVVKLDWSKTPYRDLGPLIKKPNGSWYTLDGKNRATDKKVISMAEKASPEAGRQAGPNDDMGGDNFGILDKRWNTAPPKDILPIKDAGISSPFGPREAPRLPNGGFGTKNHQGVDFRVPRGTTVYSPNNAVVLDTDFDSQLGNYIVLGDNKKDKNITHKFYHLQKSLVKKGDTIQQGQVIAKSGDTGATTGPHLHWEKWVGGQPVDPAEYMQLPGK